MCFGKGTVLPVHFLSFHIYHEGRMLSFPPKDLNLDDLKKKKKKRGSSKWLGPNKGSRVKSNPEI